jgi:hypothetical protein
MESKNEMLKTLQILVVTLWANGLSHPIPLGIAGKNRDLFVPAAG